MRDVILKKHLKKDVERIKRGDWFLLYQIRDNTVILVRAGRHSELLG
jgi:mRNA-degrading endonuclease YafQ of YafQ-DinJ toxin-antitoxin module